MSDSNELLIGVIGAGGRGGLARHAHQPNDGARLVAGADTNDAALKVFTEMYGPDALVTRDYRDILARPEIGAVFVTTPDYLHEEHAVAALDAGKAVYLEKPMAITIEGCDRILRAAQVNRGKVYLGHNMRHMTFVQKMKELIDDGAIGEVKAGWCRHFVCYGCDAYFKDWHAEQSKATSLLLQKGAHDIDVLHWLCDGYSQRVTAVGALTVYDRIEDRHDPSERGDASWHLDNWPPLAQKGLNHIIDVEDISMMLMELDNGVFCSYQQCHYTPDGWRNYTIIGTEGRVENFGDSPGECVVKLWNKRCYYKPDGDVEFPIPAVEGGHGGADPRIVQEFIDYVRNGVKATTSPIAARNSVAAGCCAAQSLRNGSDPVDIPPVPREVIEYFRSSTVA
ncbi:MAG: Gfo/Idh/MocA family oxidoreductase [Armatimonadetes bacterium]|nr:Gfo/Idh/MocA family oxidoreductase [Armatimonadota bacterium]PIY44416.1 MAG: oxidoreductase [Armatimonadetes bacterium CG_4_10_14_3_um_filter_59_10]